MSCLALWNDNLASSSLEPRKTILRLAQLHASFPHVVSDSRNQNRFRPNPVLRLSN